MIKKVKGFISLILFVFVLYFSSGICFAGEGLNTLSFGPVYINSESGSYNILKLQYNGKFENRTSIVEIQYIDNFSEESDIYYRKKSVFDIRLARGRFFYILNFANFSYRDGPFFENLYKFGFSLESDKLPWCSLGLAYNKRFQNVDGFVYLDDLGHEDFLWWPPWWRENYDVIELEDSIIVCYGGQIPKVKESIQERVVFASLELGINYSIKFLTLKGLCSLRLEDIGDSRYTLTTVFNLPTIYNFGVRVEYELSYSSNEFWFEDENTDTLSVLVFCTF